MDVVHERAAGIDISKRDAKVAVRVPAQGVGKVILDGGPGGDTPVMGG